MHDGGFLKLFRNIRYKGIIQDGPMCQVFFKGLVDASFTHTRVRIGRQFVDLSPGEFIFGRNRWAKELGLSPKVVRNRIANLEKRDTLTATQRGNEYTVFKFVNWESYSGNMEQGRPTNEQPIEASRGQAGGNQGPHMKNVKNLRLVEDKKSPSTPQGGNGYTQPFETFWEVYPKKVGKKAAFKSWKKIKGVDATEIINALKLQIEKDHFRGNDNRQYYPNPTTWLNQGRWEDDLASGTSSDEYLPPEVRDDPPMELEW